MSRGDFFVGIQISAENLAKMKRYREAVAGLEEVPIICPRCKREADRVYTISMKLTSVIVRGLEFHTAVLIK